MPRWQTHGTMWWGWPGGYSECMVRKDLSGKASELRAEWQKVVSQQTIWRSPFQTKEEPKAGSNTPHSEARKENQHGSSGRRKGCERSERQSKAMITELAGLDHEYRFTCVNYGEFVKFPWNTETWIDMYVEKISQAQGRGMDSRGVRMSRGNLLVRRLPG